MAGKKIAVVEGGTAFFAINFMAKTIEWIVDTYGGGMDSDTSYEISTAFFAAGMGLYMWFQKRIITKKAMKEISNVNN
ncbi:MAG: hypothetical protein PHS93_08460 [Candidatus Omnitrophica bacterium]|jgi:hypothetical protein|nr:hypothetical protein [Candidatus Neomarinimicrobiota bacterium]MDD5353175.1 hypothetical protein [Candidatus Omnitrophota bacterium]